MLQGTSLSETREAAREVKFMVPLDVAARILEWSRSRLSPDPYAGGDAGDEYRTTSLYFDTEDLAVYHRRGSYRRSKYRVRRYGKVEAGLYDAVLNRCVDGKKMCAHQMMAIDAAGGLGKGNVAGVQRQSTARGDRTVVSALCTPDNPLGLPRPDAP